MRLYEFADAEAQLALLRTIIDNTWTAIAQQAEQQKRVDAERKTQAKLKPRGKKSSKGTSIRIPTPPPPPTNPQLNQPPTNTAINPKLASVPYPKPTANTPIKPHNGLKTGFFGKNIGTTEKEDDGDDRHSKNGIATLKK